MYITQEADYAVRIVHCLSKAGTRRDARSISEEMGITLRFALKILGKLSSVGIVNSFKGNRGGYELAHKPEDVTLLEVLNAVDGPYCISRCLNDGVCNRGASGSCPFQSVFDSVSEEVNRQLRSVNFKNLAEKEKMLSKKQ